MAYRKLRTAFFVELLALGIAAHAQFSGSKGGMPFMAANPGTYEFQDRASIERNQIDWSLLVEKQDQEAYNNATAGAEAHYKKMYEQLTHLRNLHTESFISRVRNIPPEELQNAIYSFKTERDLFQQSIAAIDVLSEVWRGLGNAANGNQEQKKQAEYVYSKGALNLKAMTDTYQEGIAKMTSEAAALTYRYDNHMQPVETKPGMGLEDPTTNATPQSLANDLKIYQSQAMLTDDDKTRLAELSNALGSQMAQFLNTNDLHFYWYNTLQKSDKADWLDSLNLKFRLFKFAKAYYCMPTGVPALNIPQPRAFNLDYLKRGARSQVTIIQKAEFDEQAIRQTLSRFDEIFVSLQSQSGQFNDVGGIMGYVNRVNSTLTWHNEVEAYLNIMVMLKEAFADELDLITNPIGGCEKVRERYYARYKTLLDVSFKQLAYAYFGGSVPSADNTMIAFKDAGQVLLSKGLFQKQYRQMLVEHPGVSLLDQAIDKDMR